MTYSALRMGSSQKILTRGYWQRNGNEGTWEELGERVKGGGKDYIVPVAHAQCPQPMFRTPLKLKSLCLFPCGSTRTSHLQVYPDQCETPIHPAYDATQN